MGTAIDTTTSVSYRSFVALNFQFSYAAPPPFRPRTRQLQQQLVDRLTRLFVARIVCANLLFSLLKEVGLPVNTTIRYVDFFPVFS